MHWTTSSPGLRRRVRCLAFALAAACAAPAADADPAEQRQRMLDEIRRVAGDAQDFTKRRGIAPQVMRALGAVPRHEFVPPRLRERAYENRPLPIGHGQTISQPYIVALMTDLLAVDEDSVVLEVGTGSGYQAAVLAELVEGVYTIEIIEPLAEEAGARLARLGYANVRVRHADGYYGWEQHAPFDGIVVTAAASHIPPPLVRQLKPGGRMVIPVGGQFMVQQLVLVQKDGEGDVTTRQILPVRFVPLTGEH